MKFPTMVAFAAMLTLNLAFPLVTENEPEQNLTTRVTNPPVAFNPNMIRRGVNMFVGVNDNIVRLFGPVEVTGELFQALGSSHQTIALDMAMHIRMTVNAMTRTTTAVYRGLIGDMNMGSTYGGVYGAEIDTTPLIGPPNLGGTSTNYVIAVMNYFIHYGVPVNFHHVRYGRDVGNPVIVSNKREELGERTTPTVCMKPIDLRSYIQASPTPSLPTKYNTCS